MTDEPTTVTKYGTIIPINSEQLNAAGRRLNDVLTAATRSIDRALNASPEQRAMWAREAERREAEAARERAVERASHATRPLTIDALLAKMDWSREYAEHLAQPYCDCGDDIDGWSYCDHARDLGLAP